MWGGWWGTLIFSYIRWPGLFVRIQNFEFQYFWGFQKTEFLLGYEYFVDIIWDHHKIGLSRYRLEDIFWVAQISNIY